MLSRRYALVLCLTLAGGLALAGCGQLREGEDGGEEDEGHLVSPSPTTTAPAPTPAPTPSPSPAPTPAPGATLAYVPDLKPVFDSDCTRCHSGSRPPAGYNMTSYAGVMAMVQAGSASSRLVVATQPGGSMYNNFSGNRSSKSDMVRRWVVDNSAAASR